MICWGNLSLSKTIGGGGGVPPRTAASFYSAKLCIKWPRELLKTFGSAVSEDISRTFYLGL